MSKRLKFLLVASLLVNVLLIGLTLGHLSHRWGHDRHGPPPHVAKAMEALPEPIREQFHSIMEETRKDKHALRRQIKAKRQEALNLLAAEPFDEAAYQQNITAIHTMRSQTMQKMATNIKDFALSLPVEQRKQLTAALEDMMTHKHKRGWKDKEHPPHSSPPK